MKCCGKWSGLECDKVILQRLAIDGEVLLQLVKDYDNEHRFAVHMIECDALDLYYNATLSETRRVVMGVEMNA